MSVICRTFVQNTWRSDLCSNCFKCLEDHLQPEGSRRSGGIYEKLVTPRYVPQAPSLYQSRGISTSLKWRLNETLYDRVGRRDFGAQTTVNSTKTPPAQKQESNPLSNRGILIKKSSVEKKGKSRPSVDFADEEALVIGYGGNDYDSDTSPWEMGSDDGSIDLDLLDDTDEDRKISKLTKNNTEFNSFNKNLLSDSNSKREEDKMNTINNNMNNATKPSDKTISNLTYNDIKSGKAEKKLNQYFFGSNCEAIKSFLHGSVEESSIKNSNENNVNSNKNENTLEERTRNENKTSAKLSLSDNFTPLNTRTYSFISELNKSNVSSEHSSDSDYSTYRNNTGDSTDSESFHDAEDSRSLTASSFLHGTYSKSAPHLNASDSDKKYEAGSSTSGDISNFSDDSDTHDVVDEIFKAKSDFDASSTDKNCERKAVEGQSQTRENKSHSVDKEALNTVPKNEKKNKESNRCKIETCLRSKLSDTSILKSEVERKASSSDFPERKGTVTTNVSIDESTKTGNNNPPPPLNDNDKPAKEELTHSKLQQSTSISSVESEEAVPELEASQGTEEHSDSDRSPDMMANRQSKLAALAMELELARRDNDAKLCKSLTQPPLTPPEIQVRYSLPPSTKASTPSPAAENYPTIKKTCAMTSRMSSLPDVLQETPAKQKKSKFSLKKFLKRNKDSATFSPSAKESNPKAWKKQTFDRNRLSLEILHPMDLTNDVPTSADSTPTEEHKQIVSSNPGKVTFKGAGRARSLSALPQLLSDDQSSCALLECRKMDTVPARKAGTVAERKKNRPSLVRTPSCSALPNRPVVVQKTSATERAPPPKPPPPLKSKVAHPPPPPPPPPHQLRSVKSAICSPVRPPPPKVPQPTSRIYSSSSSTKELHEQNHSDKEYANLGDIRSVLTPKKPERPSAFSASTRDSEMNSSPKQKSRAEGFYEALPPTAEEEEDHYTYVDEMETKKTKPEEQKNKSILKSKITSETTLCGRPWLDIETSYAAIAAANYESLAELMTASLCEGADNFKKAENSLKWNNFTLNKEEPVQLVKERAVYNAVYNNDNQDVTLIVASRKTIATQNARNQIRYPVLSSFSDHIPKTFITTDNYILQESEAASIYILPKAKVITVSDFVTSSTAEKSNQFIHLRNYCFVLLQLIHTLKSLQAEGIEEINYDLEILILVITDEEKPPVLVLFPEDKLHLTLCDLSHDRKTLCQATLETMYHFLQINSTEDLNGCVINGERLAGPVADTFKVIGQVLMDEKASSLTQAKGFLEYMLWGPVDVKTSQNKNDDALEAVLQRWLDLQRAQMVKSTISHLQTKNNSHIGLHVYEEYQLIFLLQASIKSLKNVISKL